MSYRRPARPLAPRPGGKVGRAAPAARGRVSAARGSLSRSRAGERGYTLVALVVLLIVINIAVAIVVPLWSKTVQREKESELVFRGLQYAEAIRVFQDRFGRPPTRLEELVELEPRSIRQLWKDPLSDSGEWEPLLAGAGSSGSDLTSPPGEGGETGATGGEETSGEALERALEAAAGESRPGATGAPPGARPGAVPGLSGSDREAAGGPIEGVRPTAHGEAMRSFLGQTKYEKWEFRAQLLEAPRVSPEGVPLSPRIDPDALGRPFPEWLRRVPGSPPHPGVERTEGRALEGRAGGEGEGDG